MKTVIIGCGRKVTPGKCLYCGYDDDWDADGRDTIYCSCQCCSGCSMFNDHTSECPELKNIARFGESSEDDEG